MRKSIINKSILVVSTMAGMISFSFGGMWNNSLNSPITKSFSESISVGNDALASEDIDTLPNLHLKGINSDTRYRIYLDSTGDKSLPKNNRETYNDYLIGKGSKNSWYQHLIVGLSVDVTNYAKDKTDFLNQYRAVTFSYLYNYNFWNTWYGWSYEYGKDTPLVADVKSYQLTGDNTEWKIFEQSDASHSSNEQANLILKQEWNGNILNYNFYLGVRYSWKAGSVVKHASFASFKNDEYTFTKISEDYGHKAIKVDGLYDSKSTFTLNEYQEEIDLNSFDDEIKRKATELENSALKKTSILVQSYYGSLKVDNTTYIFSLIIRWLDIPNWDSTMLLKNYFVSRIMSTVYNDGKFSIHYENSFGNEEDTSPFDLPLEYLGMKMQGNFFLPFIYD